MDGFSAKEIFSGVKNEFYEAVSLNAAAALVVSNKIHKFEDGFDLAKKQLESGKVLTHLKKIQTLFLCIGPVSY